MSFSASTVLGFSVWQQGCEQLPLLVGYISFVGSTFHVLAFLSLFFVLCSLAVILLLEAKKFDIGVKMNLELD